MQTFTIDKQFPWRGKLTPKVISVMRMFGLDVDRLTDSAARHKCQMSLKPGDVCYITGPSGAGKSVILREIYSKVPDDEKLWLDDIVLEDGKCVVDCIEGTAFESLRLLTRAGLSDVFTVLNDPVNLSEGQKYRYRLARALASGKKFIFADEFCSNLDRITSVITAYNIQRFAKRSDITFILAGAGDHFLADLAPDVLVMKRLTGDAEVIYKNRTRANK